MRRSIAIIFIATAALIDGCSKPEDKKPTGVLPKYQQQALEKAKNVEAVLNDADARHREEMDKTQ